MFSRSPHDPMPPDPAPAQAEQAAIRETVLASITDSCMAMREQHGILFDSADGMRADLLARGWPQHMAEALVFTWTQRNLITMTPVEGGGE